MMRDFSELNGIAQRLYTAISVTMSDQTFTIDKLRKSFENIDSERLTEITKFGYDEEIAVTSLMLDRAVDRGYLTKNEGDLDIDNDEYRLTDKAFEEKNLKTARMRYNDYEQ